jgi:REP element-mobilizing transposase RayT
LDAPLALHHVWNRGIARGDIFRDDIDRLDFLRRIETLVRTEHFAIYAWALMSNHFHLLTRTGNLGLSATMRILQGGYANFFNARHRRSGHLFQNRFKNILVGEEAYLLELLRYIHLNPLRAGLVADLDALDCYPWTGHAAMMGHHNLPWHDCDFGLAPFGRTRAQARTAYRAFLADGLRSPEPDLDGGGLRRSLGLWQRLTPMRRGREDWSCDERIYGSSGFVDSVLAALNGEPPRKPPPMHAGHIIDHVMEQLARRTGLAIPVVRSNSKRPCVVKVRRALCYLAICHAAIPASHVARHLGIDASTARRNAAVGERALMEFGYSPSDLLLPIPASHP